MGYDNPAAAQNTYATGKRCLAQQLLLASPACMRRLLCALRTMVREASMVEDTLVILKSQDTRGSSDTPRMPFRGPLAASRKACRGEVE